jgi:hypothetical protein
VPDRSDKSARSVDRFGQLWELGLERAVILLEEDCKEFSNIEGIGQIRFRRNDIRAKFDEIRRVLEREGIIQKA